MDKRDAFPYCMKEQKSIDNYKVRYGTYPIIVGTLYIPPYSCCPDDIPLFHCTLTTQFVFLAFFVMPIFCFLFIFIWMLETLVVIICPLRVFTYFYILLFVNPHFMVLRTF